ncbi:hypothetical protein BDB01DRAFT_45845 [Pilobolus umbonatus]|nr:hypothetical protein BDB01DRAFT_45845 [Pilobolus umbonatus]
MSGIIWNPPILSPIIIAYSTMDNANKSLKRTRSTEIDDINTKRSKHTVNEQELTRIYPYNHHHATTIPTIEDNKLPLKPISISTRSPLTPTVTTSLPHYEHINTVLHSLHVTRYGNPELRERWWEHEEEEEELDEMEVDRVDEYHDMNSMLKQLFLQRHKLN